MKNIVLSAVAVLAMSSFAVAGGDIAPVEEPMVVVEPVITDSGFYIGGGYGYMQATDEETYRDALGGKITDTYFDDNYNEIMLQMGYKFNSYVAIEGRYWFGLDSTVDAIGSVIDGESYGDVGINAWGIYVKPMYPVTDALDIYALLGYGAASVNYSGYSSYYDTFISGRSDSFDGFSWGLGASYSFTDNVSIFVDYTSIYNDDTSLGNTLTRTDREEDTELSTVNFGVSYMF